MSKLIKKINTIMSESTQDSEEFSNLSIKFYSIITDSNLSKKERDHLDVILGKMLSLQDDASFLEGAKFGGKIFFELLK